MIRTVEVLQREARRAPFHNEMEEKAPPIMVLPDGVYIGLSLNL